MVETMIANCLVYTLWLCITKVLYPYKILDLTLLHVPCLVVDLGWSLLFECLSSLGYVQLVYLEQFARSIDFLQSNDVAEQNLDAYLGV